MQPFLNNLSQIIERTADDKKDIFGIDNPLFSFTGLPKVLNRFQLRHRIMGHVQVNLCLLHGFKKCPLHTGSGHIQTMNIISARDLVNLIYINNAVLGLFNIPVSLS